MRLHSLLFLFQEALEGIIRHRLMALAALSTSTAGFFVFGAFLVTIYILQSITGSTLSELSFAAFMKPETTRADSLRVQNAIRKIPGVVYVRLVTKEEDWARQKRDLGSRLPLEGITDNPLTDGFEIRTKRLEDMSAVAKQVRKIQGVDAVQVMTDIVSKLRALLRLLKTLG
ncbi:MAG TPA: permease-like cell division protein FtsX, partial [Armatimonadota bacterium]|nr:permease-like cell division protein FtsX [Armatimonadota bacterium]